MVTQKILAFGLQFEGRISNEILLVCESALPKRNQD